MSDADPALHRVAEAVARLTADNARLQERLAEGEERFRLLARRVVRVQEAEQGRLSRELHDGVGQSLTALKIEADLLAGLAAEQDSPVAARLLALAHGLEGALEVVRHVSHRMRPQMLDELGLEPTLRWLTRTFAQRTGIAVTLAVAVPDGGDPEVETLVFRVVQEALTNAARHAQCREVAVDVAQTGARLVASVTDDGVGFDPEAALATSDGDRGFGVRGMRDRARLLGARFAIRSRPGEGTRVEVDLPLQGSAR